MCLHLCLQSADFGEAFMALRPAARLLWYRKLYKAANEQVWPVGVMCTLCYCAGLPATGADSGLSKM